MFKPVRKEIQDELDPPPHSQWSDWQECSLDDSPTLYIAKNNIGWVYDVPAKSAIGIRPRFVSELILNLIKLDGPARIYDRRADNIQDLPMTIIELVRLIRMYD